MENYFNKQNRHEWTIIIFGRQSHKHMCWRVNTTLLFYEKYRKEGENYNE